MQQIRKRQRGKAAMQQELDDTFVANPLALKETEATSAVSTESITTAGAGNLDSTTRRAEVGNTLHVARPSTRFSVGDMSEAEIGNSLPSVVFVCRRSFDSMHPLTRVWDLGCGFAGADFRRSAMINRQSLVLDGDEALKGARLNPLHALSPKSAELRSAAEKRFSTIDSPQLEPSEASSSPPLEPMQAQGSGPTTPMTPAVTESASNEVRPSVFALLDSEVPPELLAPSAAAAPVPEPVPEPAAARFSVSVAPVPPARSSVSEIAPVPVPVAVPAVAAASFMPAPTLTEDEVAPPAPAPEEDETAPPAPAPEEADAPAPPAKHDSDSDDDVSSHFALAHCVLSAVLIRVCVLCALQRPRRRPKDSD
jgi:hypothetical protein